VRGHNTIGGKGRNGFVNHSYEKFVVAVTINPDLLQQQSSFKMLLSMYYEFARSERRFTKSPTVIGFLR
jgi:N6-adenosine-specific RNA methylase IME4